MDFMTSFIITVKPAK